MTEQLGLWPGPRARTAAAEHPFRPIQYLGSKARLLGEIRRAVDEADPAHGPALDIFSGSGVVAAALGRDRDVTAVDVQEYARVLGSALVAPARFTEGEVARLAGHARATGDRLAAGGVEAVLAHERAATEALRRGDPEPLCAVVEDGSIVVFASGEGPRAGALATALAPAAAAPPDPALTVTRYYGGAYFGYRQALMLDGLLAAVRALPPGPERDTGLAAVLGAASECVTSVGSHFAQPVRPRDRDGRPKVPALRALARRRERDVIAIFADRLRRFAAVPGAAHSARVVRADYEAFLRAHDAPVGVVYADPPYTRDHYSRFYHVLETMARGDAPELSTVTIGGVTTLSRGLYRRDRHQSPFCIRSEVPGAFRALFAAVRRLDAPLVVSYSPYASGTAARPQPRLLTVMQVADLAAESFRSVEVRSAGRYAHSKFNATRLNGHRHQAAELFLICRP
jgi:adenine-specific DNA-methyltransferase